MMPRLQWFGRTRPFSWSNLLFALLSPSCHSLFVLLLLLLYFIRLYRATSSYFNNEKSSYRVFVRRPHFHGIFFFFLSSFFSFL